MSKFGSLISTSGVRPVYWSIAACLSAMFFFFSSINQCANASTNSLNLGLEAKIPDGTALSLNRIQNFNYLSRNEILQMRVNALSPSMPLVAAPYIPTPAVFSEIVDGKPWWGMAGQFIWGQGQRSIEGAAEESRFILNPLLLVGANPWTTMIWKKEKITEEDLKSLDFPYTWNPQELRFWPRAKMAQVVYDVTAYNGKLKQLDDKLERTEECMNFGLVAYNARDFGFNYLYISPNLSSNIENTHKGGRIVEIKQYIHTGDSSKYPGGCNNMSPAMDEIDHLKIQKLPARATVLLWKNYPTRLTNPPDLSFVLDFK